MLYPDGHRAVGGSRRDQIVRERHKEGEHCKKYFMVLFLRGEYFRFVKT